MLDNLIQIVTEMVAISVTLTNLYIIQMITYKTNLNCNLNEFHNWNITDSR